MNTVPADVNEAAYVLPCIVNTLPGKAPENWELPLHFMAAPPSLTVMPVIELTPSQQSSQTQNVAEDQAITVNTEIETSDGYILIGSSCHKWCQGNPSSRLYAEDQRRHRKECSLYFSPGR